MKAIKTLNKIFLLSTSFHTALMGTVFIIQVLRIYFFNDKTFNREICGQYILEILPVILLWIGLIIGSFIYFNITNFKYKNISKISNVARTNNLKRICPEISDVEINKKLNKIEKSNKIASIILITVILISSLMGLGYLLNIKHFEPNEINNSYIEQAGKMSLHLMPWVIISLGTFILYAIHIEKQAKHTNDILLEVIKTNGKVTYKEIKQNNILKTIAQCLILTISVVFIVIGVINGGAADVLQKAVNICTECIGLG